MFQIYSGCDNFLKMLWQIIDFDYLDILLSEILKCSSVQKFVSMFRPNTAKHFLYANKI